VPMAEMLGADADVRVRTPQRTALAGALQRAGAGVAMDPDGALQVRGLDAEQVGEVAFAIGVRLHELTRATTSLEAAYYALTGEDVEYRAGER
jgi:ABC-2 type transport system ATP-binding protein